MKRAEEKCGVGGKWLARLGNYLWEEGWRGSPSTARMAGLSRQRMCCGSGLSPGKNCDAQIRSASNDYARIDLGGDAGEGLLEVGMASLPSGVRQFRQHNVWRRFA
jgi:hypothetical protein